MWQAIADPETAERCWSAIDDIERSLVEHAPDDDPLLASGKAGLALFLTYLGAARGEGSDCSDRALDALSQSIDALAGMQLLPSLYGGFAGIGWTAEHLARHFFEADEDLSADIAEALRELLSTDERLRFELINGLSGFGTYLLERLPQAGAAEVLARVLDHLESTAEGAEAGLTWHTPQDWLPDWQRERLPGGYYNLGVAHGVPGIVGFLAAAHRDGLRDPRIPRLAEGAVRWVLAQKLRDGDGTASVFPAFVAPDSKAEPTRTAWCYGDLGISAVLLSAARSFGRQDWEEEALALARRAAHRSMASAETVDANLCHGTAGLAHVFNRLYQATGHTDLREAALVWIRRALDMRRPGEGMAGFLSYVSLGPDAGSWKGYPGFLIGVAGIGLALLATVTEVEPSWDRVMLVDVPPNTFERNGA